MPGKPISQLPSAEKVKSSDALILYQDDVSKQLPAAVLESWLRSMVGGHGGIESIKPVNTSGLTDTYRIKYTDGDTVDFTVTNGATPQKGTDYWTTADIAEIKSYVDDAILGGAW